LIGDVLVPITSIERRGHVGIPDKLKLDGNELGRKELRECNTRHEICTTICRYLDG
jgi:hypothetical protein